MRHRGGVERFSVGIVMSSGLRQLVRVTVRFLPLLVVVYAPTLYLLSVNPDWWAVTLLVDVPVAAILSHGIVHELAGERPTVWASITAGLRRTPTALGAVLLMLFIVAAILAAIVLPVRVGGGSAVFVVVAVIGVGGASLSLYSRWFVVIPAIVHEDPGAAGALSHSSDLTRGHRLAIVAILLLGTAAYVGSLAALVMVGLDGDWDALEVGWATVAGDALGVVFALYRMTMSATAYHCIRAEKQAASPEELARVFG